MGINSDFLSGIVRGLADQQETRRADTRKREDAELERRKGILDHIWQNADPSYYAQALGDYMALSDAGAGKRESKGGIGAAFSGAHKDIILPFLDAIHRGDIPLTGDDPRTKEIPQPPTAQVAPPPESKLRFSAGGSPDTQFNIPRFITGLGVDTTAGAYEPPQTASTVPPVPVSRPPMRPLFPDKVQQARDLKKGEADDVITAAVDKAKRVGSYLSSPDYKALPPEQQDAVQRELTGYAPPAPQRLGTPKVVKDLNSPTGYSWVSLDPQSGKEASRVAGAPNPEKVTGPQAKTNELAQMLIADDPTLTPEQATNNARRLLLKNVRMAASLQLATIHGKELDADLKTRLMSGTLTLPQATTVMNSILPEDSTAVERAQMLDDLTSGEPPRQGGKSVSPPPSTISPPPRTVSGAIPTGLGDVSRHVTPKTRQDTIDVNSFLNQIQSTEAQGDKAGWQGVGVLAGPAGTLQFKALGTGNPEQELLRIKLGNLYGDLAKLRAGAALTKNEEKRLDSYAPEPNESAERVRVKLRGLREFWQDHLKAVKQGVRGSVEPPPSTISATPPQNPKEGDQWNSPTGLTFWGTDASGRLGWHAR